MVNNKIPFLFLLTGLIVLLFGLLFGIIGSLQYLFPGFFKEQLNFTQSRPLHVSLVITWIFGAATGGIYYYIQKIRGQKLWSEKLAFIQWVLLISTGASILYCYLSKYFGGREYFEFPPLLAIPILITWIIFMLNFFMTLKSHFQKAPVYIWMWSTGIIFFFLTFIESYAWLIPFFRDSIVRDMTVQWKAMGSMVGSWNMLVYGTGFYIMEKISGDDKLTRSPITFFFYFLGLTNLMFNWGHHTYIVPASAYVKYISYIISMTELLIVGFIIRNWSSTLSLARKNFHLIPHRFLTAADFWIFLNLILAILISVPSVNQFTHGTHITVAHAMGATIGINSMILFASLFYIRENSSESIPLKHQKKIQTGFWLTNISLFVFWISLIGAGVGKLMQTADGSAFQVMMIKLQPWFRVFLISGFGIFMGITLLSIPVFSTLLTEFRKKIILKN